MHSRNFSLSQLFISGAWPWITAVIVYFNNDPKLSLFLCGGTLISDRHVVTAAHCMQFKDVTYVVRLGEDELDNDNDGAHPIDVVAEKIIVHPNYNDITKENDIAILRLKNTINFTGINIRNLFFCPTCTIFGRLWHSVT